MSLDSLNAATQSLRCYFKNKETEAQKGLIIYPHLKVQEQARLGKKGRIMVSCGGVWVLTGKGPEGTSWGGSILDLDLDLGRLHRCMSG